MSTMVLLLYLYIASSIRTETERKGLCKVLVAAVRPVLKLQWDSLHDDTSKKSAK